MQVAAHETLTIIKMSHDFGANADIRGVQEVARLLATLCVPVNFQLFKHCIPLI